MFLAETGEEQLFESFAEIAVIVTDMHEAGLNDVGHNYLYLVRLSTLIVWEKGKCYMVKEVFLCFSMLFSK